MKKNEYLSTLSLELKKLRIADADDIVSEYEQHFAFKQADGFAEEEIAAKLGDPADLAAQFTGMGGGKPSGTRTLTAGIGLGILDVFAAMMFILLFAWTIVMAAAAIACAGAGGSLILGLNIALIPSMPYFCALLLGISLLALAVLSATGCIYYTAFVRQLLRAYGRFHRNTMTTARGGAALPPLPVRGQLSPGANRRTRTITLISLAVFAVSAIVGYISCMIAAGAFEFWHIWGWFV